MAKKKTPKQKEPTEQERINRFHYGSTGKAKPHVNNEQSKRKEESKTKEEDRADRPSQS